MNYIRGAVVNAISAPYQYYKDINPSTLTGAIDVIVIQRPAPNGDGIELACSPFHVRFGKWQVLRPAEKKVNVSVNDNPIPYNMKIGDAGEAFFVFETDDDVPEDLITSPILQATTPSTEAAAASGTSTSEKDAWFGAGERSEKANTVGEEKKPSEKGIEEPEYLDLDGRPQAHLHKETANTPRQSHHVPSIFKTSPPRTNFDTSFLNATKRRDSPPGDRTPEMLAQDQRVDQALNGLKTPGHAPEIEYHSDVALDVEGYHSAFHDRQRSDQTVRSSDFDEFRLPPSQLRLGVTQSSPMTPKEPESPRSDRDETPSVHFPMFRATSEPPPDVGTESELCSPHPGHSTSDLLPHHHNKAPTRLQVAQQHQQEYMWEWGNFPQPSPMKTTFLKSGRVENPAYLAPGSISDGWRSKTKTVQVRKGRLGGMRLPVLQDSEDEVEQGSGEDKEQRGRVLFDKEHGRSHSVPSHQQSREPSSNNRRDRRRWKEYEDFDDEDDEDEVAILRASQHEEDAGDLTASKADPSKFILLIEGQKVGFQLSLTDFHNCSPEKFDLHLVDFEQFLDDAGIISNPKLVIRWVGAGHHITRADSSRLLDALTHWREMALKRRRDGQTLRPLSPLSDNSSPASPNLETSPPGTPQHEKMTHMRAKSEPPEQAYDEGEKQAETPNNDQKPSSLSWVQWWSRSRKQDPTLTTAASTSESAATSTKVIRPANSNIADEAVESPAVHGVQTVARSPAGNQAIPAKQTRYAKTLRLTSDQLKALNLQPGANTITFSLSATGAVAATARIFVWDYTDLVVVSDIDGTITKSDGLGHVFAMIGRDWTHLGVAKLYTDITRNGYKVMYLTSRAIGQADATRGYLKGIKQNNYQLPEGPVIMSPDRLMASLHREVVLRKPEVFKMACLRDIQRLFGEHTKHPFYAGFGNRITDALSYRTVNIPSARIFTIDTYGEVKMELLELAGYKSSYIHMTDLVDQMFPPIHRKWAPEYTDFNYWRAPVQEYSLPDFLPPSPALSARSDTSNQSTLARLRNFSLVGNRQSIAAVNGQRRAGERDENEADARDGFGKGRDGDGHKSNHLRQMSSFERLSSTLGFMTTVNDSLRRSASPDSGGSSYDSEDDDEATLSDGAIGRRRRKERRRSMTSMPGSLMDEEMHFSDGEGDIEEGYNEDVDHEAEDNLEEEEAFDEDLLAAGEMQKVPFLYG